MKKGILSLMAAMLLATGMVSAGTHYTKAAVDDGPDPHGYVVKVAMDTYPDPLSIKHV
ncbi:hypothetical protein JJB07_13605 [Tumebacillus sp. ITR2]|uniref:Uncharacterized protein n=1 Tax=Tumebacillus amylolyticus TaxID=2801339 RepID=A0ABS1JBN4_9BACL|nr:hypothetical protein [Tumebacillus amylolyticus]MBL0387671.1 hypothetical protein [Tumebacillus amylolyticus]